MNLYATNYFKFELQLKFRKNKNYSSVIVNFFTGVPFKKKVNLWLKFREKKINMKEDRVAVTFFRFSKSLYSHSVLFEHIYIIILVPFSEIVCTVEYTRSNFRHTSAFIFQFSGSRNILTFFSILENFCCLVFVTVAVFSFSSLLITAGVERCGKTLAP